MKFTKRRCEVLEQCGARVTNFLARDGAYFPCALEKGHEGPHCASGECVRHGYYLGEPYRPPQCPHWPTCIKGLEETDG